MPGRTTNADIMHKLGGIEADIKHAEQGRRVLHEKQDHLVDVLNEVAKTLQGTNVQLHITTDLAAKTRQDVDALALSVKDDVIPEIKKAVEFQKTSEPLLKTVRQVKWIAAIVGGTGVFTVGGALGMLVFARDQLAQIVRQLLELPLT